MVDENSIYIVFKLEPVSEDCAPVPDEIETDAAQFFTCDEIELLAPCPTIFKVLAKGVIANETTLLAPREIVGINKNPYQIYF